MTTAQTIEVKLSTCRQRLNELLQVETRSAEEQTEMETLTKEVSAKNRNCALHSPPKFQQTKPMSMVTRKPVSLHS